MATKKQKLKCDQPDCGQTFTSPQELGKHRYYQHGIQGTSNPSKAKRYQNLGPIDPNNPLQCQQCGWTAKFKGGIKLHMRKKHGDLRLTRKDTQLVKRAAKAPVTLNGHAPQGEDHSNANGIPDALIALATGRFQELCRGMAFEHDLPPRLFAARVAAFVYGSTVR